MKIAWGAHVECLEHKSKRAALCSNNKEQHQCNFLLK